jgi:hypothetical protein
MPIPPGARQIPGNPNRVRLADGTVVTRSRARTLGAQMEGYASENQRRKNPERRTADTKYFNAWARSPAGKHAVKIAQAQAKAEGRAYRKSELQTQLIAARNDRPHPSTGSGGGQIWRDFGTRYQIFGHRDYVKY